MSRTMMKSLGLLGVLFAVCLGSVRAERVGGSFSISCESINGGGVSFASGSHFALGATVGQPGETEPVCGDAFLLMPGFWGQPESEREAVPSLFLFR